jgi:hypothetical protein
MVGSIYSTGFSPPPAAAKPVQPGQKTKTQSELNSQNQGNEINRSAAQNLKQETRVDTAPKSQPSLLEQQTRTSLSSSVNRGNNLDISV